jgi:hypothetical protein
MSTAKPHVTDKVIETREIMAVWSKVGISLKLENGARKDVRILSQKKIGNTEHWIGIDIPDTTSLEDLQAVISAALEKINEKSK